MTQADLFSSVTLPKPVPERAFDGGTYDVERDYLRLDKQIGRVFSLMRDGRWRTLRQISDATNDPEASVSARLRDLRKPKHGGFEVEHRNVGGGIWEYRLLLPDDMRAA